MNQYYFGPQAYDHLRHQAAKLAALLDAPESGRRRWHQAVGEQLVQLGLLVANQDRRLPDVERAPYEGKVR